MNSTGITNSEPQASESTRFGINEAQLRSEIGFWREMIDSCCDTQPGDSIERMHQALALAESRLHELFESHRVARRAGNLDPSNVYWLDRAQA